MSERDFRREAIELAATGLVAEIERRLRAEAALEELKAENIRLKQECMQLANDLDNLKKATQALAVAIEAQLTPVIQG